MDIEAAKETLARYLKEKKLRPTRERFLLLEEIMKTDGHFDADGLFAMLGSKKLKASRATVYNTLELLVECGLISKYRFGDNHARFEKAFGRPRHDHLICLNCGDIIEFVNGDLGTILRDVCEEQNFKLRNSTLQIFGICSKCQNKKLDKHSKKSPLKGSHV